MRKFATLALVAMLAACSTNQTEERVGYYVGHRFLGEPDPTQMTSTGWMNPKTLQIHNALVARYEAEPFIEVLPFGQAPGMGHVMGSNFCHIGVIGDRVPGRALVVSTLDNLCKGSSGQAMQNANLMLGEDETTGLMLAPVFP